MDTAYLTFSPKLGCFCEGWGDRALLAEPLAETALLDAVAPQIRWRRARVHGSLRILEGEFPSPEELLPLESRVARVKWLAPRQGRPRAIVVALPSWGDETFAARQRLFTIAAEHGVSAILLEGAFYGSRRRVGQLRAQLRTVSDFMLMGRATIREAHALLAWAERESDRVGIAGYSMGGLMSAMAGALSRKSIAIAAMAPAMTPASVFLEGPLRRDLRWDALGGDAEARLRSIFGELSILALPPPADPSRAVLLGTKRDAIVPPEDIVAIGRHWGVAPRWLDEGHVSAIALRPRALAQAVIDAMVR